MRYISRLIIVGAVILASPWALRAQEHKRVEVTKNYTHEVGAATKIIVPTDINDDEVYDPDITYNINPETWQIELEDHNFDPATASFYDFNSAERLYTQFAVGYPLVSNAVVRYAMHNKRLGYFGVGIEHDGDFYKKMNAIGEKQFIADSYKMSNRVDVAGGVMTGRQMLEARADYDCSIMNRYAKVMPDRLYFHDANLNLSYGDDFVDLSRLNFGIVVDGGFWSSRVPSDEPFNVSEYSANAAVKLARNFKDNVIGIDAGFGMWQGGKLANYRDMAINLGVSYSRTFGIMGVEAGLGYMYDKVSGRAKPSHFVLPSVKLTFDFGKVGLMPFVELQTNIKHNTLEALYADTPYIDYLAMQGTFGEMASTRSYDLHFGIMGTDRASKLAYRVYLGGNFMRDQMLWYMNEYGTFGFDQNSNIRLFVGAEVEYHPVGGLKLAANVRAHSDNTQSQYEVSDARLTAGILADYRLKRWKFNLAGDFVGARRWSGAVLEGGAVPLAFTAPAYFNLKANVAFKVTNTIEAYVDGYNLLNQQMFSEPYYTDRGLTCLVGVKMDF